MISAHKNNHRIPNATKRAIGLKALKGQEKITQISQFHKCSRTTVYAQKDKALSAVNKAFDSGEESEVLFYIPVSKEWIKQVVLALCLVCQSSYRNIILFFLYILDYPISIGSIFNIIDEASVKAQAINSSYNLNSIKESAADEIFHRNKPILSVVDIDSRYCALLQKADKRDYETWGIHLLDLQSQCYLPETTIMDSAKGLVKGHKEVMPETTRRHDHFHLIKDIKDCSRYLKNKEKSLATTSLNLLNKKNKAKNLNAQKKYNGELCESLSALNQLEEVRHQFNTLTQWLQFDVLQLASYSPENRAMLYDFILTELKALAGHHPHRINTIVTSLDTQRELLLDIANKLNEKFNIIANQYNQPIDIIWRICYAMRYSIDSFKYNNEVYDIESIIGAQYDEIEDEVLNILETTHRCSSMVENFNSRLRPYLDERKFISQNILSLIQFYLNHKPFMRSKHDRLEGKTPAEAMTDKKMISWLEMLGFTRFKRPAA